MIYFDAAFERLERTSGTMIDVAQDFSVCYWFRPNLAIPSGSDRATYILDKSDFSQFIGIWQQQTTGKIEFSAVNGIGGTLAIDYTGAGVNNFNIDIHIALTYNATTHLFSYYVNGALVGTGTCNINATTLTEEYLGDDTSGGWSNEAFQYFRMWQRELTLNEVIAEMSSTTIVQTNNVFRNTPLTTNAVDISGNGYDWVENLSPSYNNNAPVNQYAISATVISSLPFTFNASILVNLVSGYTPTVWFKYTPSDSYVYGSFIFGDLVDYIPRLDIYTPDSTTHYANATEKSQQFPVVSGNDYFFKISPTTSNTTANLLFNLQRGPELFYPAGGIFVPDDSTDLPATIINPAAQAVVKFINPFPSCENGDILENGKFLAEDLTVGGFMRFYNTDFTVLASPAYTHSIGSLRTNNSLNKFYVSIFATAPTTVKVYSVDDAGVLSAQLASLTGYFVCDGGATSPDGSIFYFNGKGTSTGSDVIRRWDLVNDVALADLATVPSGYPIKDMLGLPDGSIIVLAYKATVTRALVVYHYSAAGSLLTTYTISEVPGSIKPRLAYSLSNPDTFWLWIHLATAFSQYIEIDVATGARLQDFTIPEYENTLYQPSVTATPVRFGNSNSCPFFILRAAAEGRDAYSGLYVLTGTTTIPPNPSRHDTLVDANGNSVDLAIPNPFVETALLPTEDQ